MTRTRPAACAAVAASAACVALAAVLGGCSRMDAALGQQWVVVQLASNTPLATAKHVTAICSRASGLRADPVQPTSPGKIVGSVRFISTQATDADMARLQQCLQRFPFVQGLTMSEPGD
jgi:hypothetical protein